MHPGCEATTSPRRRFSIQMRSSKIARDSTRMLRSFRVGFERNETANEGSARSHRVPAATRASLR